MQQLPDIRDRIGEESTFRLKDVLRKAKREVRLPETAETLSLCIKPARNGFDYAGQFEAPRKHRRMWHRNFPSDRSGQ